MKPVFLLIETSDLVCSVALSSGNKILEEISAQEEYSHSKSLLSLVDDILVNNKMKKEDLSAIAISAGPGSYTGLRIGASFCKAACLVLNIPLLAVSTLKSLAFSIREQKCDYIYALIDARREEVYRAVYDKQMQTVLEGEPYILEDNFAQNLTQNKTVLFVGSGAEKSKKYIHSEDAVFVSDLKPKASMLLGPALELFNNQSFADLAYFEPQYIKAYHSNQKSK